MALLGHRIRIGNDTPLPHLPHDLIAIGHIGIARCFYVSGRLARALYDPEDPIAENRDLDDQWFAIDHFQEKLLKLSGTFQTKTGHKLTEKRHKTLQDFVAGLLDEVAPQSAPRAQT